MTALCSMHLTVTDTEKRCASATRALQDSLLELAQNSLQSGDHRAALITRFRAYALQPGNSPVLHSIAEVYDAMGDTESAQLCRRGVVPESAEVEFFKAKTARVKQVPARKASESQHFAVYQPEKVNLPVPTANADSRQRPEFRARHTESRGSFVSVLSNGTLWFDGFNTVVTDSRKRILKEHVKGNCAVVSDVSRHHTQKSMPGTVCFIDARSSSIYYHWMLDVLPKFALIQKAGIDLDAIDHFIVRCQSNFQRQTLSHLGIDSEKVMPAPAGQTLQADRLVVPYLKHDRGDRVYNGLGLGMASWVPDWLSQTFISGAISAQPQRLYLSRAKRGTRAPVNEQLLLDALQQRGFSSVTLEDLSVIQQANLLASASVVVSPHGAGLTNIAFCQPGTLVVEIFGDYVVPCYWALSTLARLNYHHYLATEAPEENHSNQHTIACNTSSAIDPDNRVSKPNADQIALADRRNLGIDLNVNDFVEKLDAWIDVADTSAR